MQAIFAYIPVVHSGTLTFLEKYRELPILLLDNQEGKKENPYLERDIRALSATLIKKELEAHGFETVEILAPASLYERVKDIELLIVPEDEIVDFFLEKYAPTVSVKKVNVFLRWTKQISTIEHEVPSNRIITTGEFENEILSTLEIEAQKSPDWWRQIAAAIVKENQIVAVAYNKHLPSQHALTLNGDPRSNLDAGQGPAIYTSIHAEASVLAQSARKGISVEGADIYVTTFPCPTCARSLVEAGIAKVFYIKGYSLLDAEEILKGAGIEIVLVKEELS
jgi:dCMP deaminase